MERGCEAAGVPGHEARRALPCARSAAHCTGVKAPFHSAPATVVGRTTPSRSSPSRYVPRSAGREDGAGSKLRFLSPAAGGVVGTAQRGGGQVQGGAAAHVSFDPLPRLPNLCSVDILTCAQRETRLRRPLLERLLHLQLRGSQPAGAAEADEGKLRHREPRDAGMRAARRVMMRPGRLGVSEKNALFRVGVVRHLAHPRLEGSRHARQCSRHLAHGRHRFTRVRVLRRGRLRARRPDPRWPALRAGQGVAGSAMSKILDGVAWLAASHGSTLEDVIIK